MKNKPSVYVSSASFPGTPSCLDDPSETILVIRMPYLTPRAERLIKAAVEPIVKVIVEILEEN